MISVQALYMQNQVIIAKLTKLGITDTKCMFENIEEFSVTGRLTNVKINILINRIEAIKSIITIKCIDSSVYEFNAFNLKYSDEKSLNLSNWIDINIKNIVLMDIRINRVINEISLEEALNLTTNH